MIFMKLKNGFKIGLCLLLSINLILTGCNSNNDGDATEITTETAPIATQNTTDNNILRTAMHKPTTFNPLKNCDITVDNSLKPLFEPLFNISNNMELIPNIAESMSVSGNVVTIKVKDNIYWSDGKAIGADDVVYSLNVIKSAPDNSIYKSSVMYTSDFVQTGDKTLNIVYTNPVGAVGYSLAFPILPKHHYENNEYADMNPIGCGSYKLEGYNQATGAILKATQGINGTPSINEIHIELINDEDTMIDSIKNNIIDVLSVDAETLGKIGSNNSKLYTSNQFEYVGFNINRKIFATPDARKAITHIMPIDNIVNGIYINHITKSFTPVNPDSIYADMTGVDTYNTDVSTANTLILSLGLTKEDFSFKILVNNENPARIESAKILSDAFNAYGMNTSVDIVSFEEYKNRLATGDFDMYMGCVELKPNLDLSQLLGSQGSVNFTGFKDSRMDQYISTVNASMDFQSYKKALNELNKYISYTMPITGIGFKKKVLVCSDNISGDITPLFNNYYYKMQNWSIGS